MIYYYPFNRKYLLFQYPSIRRDGYHLPGDELAACLESLLHCVFDPAAAGNFHACYGDAFNIISCDDLRQFFRIISFVQLGAADERNAVADKFIMKISVGIGGAVKIGRASCRERE